MDSVGRSGWAATIVGCAAALAVGIAAVVVVPVSAAAARTPRHRAAAHADKTPALAPGEATSPNWSGYVASPNEGNDGVFSQVSAQWVQPAVSCPKKDAWTLFWVGFDGWPATDRSVEQGGTSARCVDGVAQYSAFYEMWPAFPVTDMFSVEAGDQISASVDYGGGQFVITVSDSRHGQLVQTAQQSEPCPGTCLRSSAEWIAESPAHFGTDRWFPLANYGTVTFTSATATDAAGVSGPISYPLQWSASGIERKAGASKPLATVSTLQSGGYGFSDTWKRH